MEADPEPTWRKCECRPGIAEKLKEEGAIEERLK